MQIRCGNCKGVHDSTAEVRACYQTPAVAKITDRQLSYLTDLTAHRVMPDNGPGISDLANLSKQEASVMIEQMLQQPVKPIGNGSIIPGDLPDGRYAFIEDNKPRFYRIATSKENGHRYIRKVL